MRRDSSTVVVLVGDADEGILAGLARSPNISVARAPAAEVPGAGQPARARPGWEAGALALGEAAGRRSTYVIVPDDPLAGVAARWRAMWAVPGGLEGAAGFEIAAAEALAAWRDMRFELPDYYLVMAAAQPDGATADLHLGPFRAVRPRRVAVASLANAPTQAAQTVAAQIVAAQIVDALRSQQHGPWWPPLDELLDAPPLLPRRSRRDTACLAITRAALRPRPGRVGSAEETQRKRRASSPRGRGGLRT